MLWQNENTIVVGLHQNTIEEINQDYVVSHGVNVVRRMTGGGAVYHDLGNLNYSIIADRDEEQENEMQYFCANVIRTLQKFGIPAEFNGRNDIVVDGKKVSGTAQRIYKHRILHHGCLLFDSNLDKVSASLKVRKEKFQSKSVKSVRSRVGNIKDYAARDMDIQIFREKLINELMSGEQFEILQLTEEEQHAVKKLQKEKYETWEWNYGKSMKSNCSFIKKFDAGLLEVYLNLEKGMIRECQILGDFMALSAVTPIEEALIGTKLQYHEILTKLNRFHLEEYFSVISAEQVAKCICGMEE